VTNYPHASEAIVRAVYDPQGCWEKTKKGDIKHFPAAEAWDDMVAEVQHDFITRCAVDVSRVRLIYEVSFIAEMIGGTDDSLTKMYEEKRHWYVAKFFFFYLSGVLFVFP
jgi:hypothetical protein